MGKLSEIKTTDILLANIPQKKLKFLLLVSYEKISYFWLWC